MRLIVIFWMACATLLYADDQTLLGFGFGSGYLQGYKKTLHTKLNYSQVFSKGWAWEAGLGFTLASAKVNGTKSFLDLDINGGVNKYFSPYYSFLPYMGAHLGVHFLSDPFDPMMIGYGLKTGVMIRGLDPYLLRIELKQSVINNSQLDPVFISMSLEKPLKKNYFRTDRFIKRRVKTHAQ